MRSLGGIRRGGFARWSAEGIGRIAKRGLYEGLSRRQLRDDEGKPGDYDVAWEPTNVDVALLLRLDPVFGVFDAGRAAQKAKYGGEFFPSSANEVLTGRTFLDFFQVDKDTGAPKGIVAIDL